MRFYIPALVLLTVLSFDARAQNDRSAAPVPNQYPSVSSDALYTISADVSRLAKAVESMNRNWKSFFDTFSSNQGGMVLDERQKKLIFALEVLNRLEQSMVNMQKLKLELEEKQSTMRLKLAGVTDDLRPESIDRFTAWRGTTDAEAVRDIRRQALAKEQRELSFLLSQIARDLEKTNEEIRRSELQIASIRARIFGEVEKELADL